MDVSVHAQQGQMLMVLIKGADRVAITDAIMIGLRTNRPNGAGPTIDPTHIVRRLSDGLYLLTCRPAEGVEPEEIVHELKFQLETAPKTN